jgi:hypothetical protein
VTSEISTENFDKFEEEEPYYSAVDKNKKGTSKKLDMNFIGYTYKADVEHEKLKKKLRAKKWAKWTTTIQILVLGSLS